jgi:hypothetical protein
MGGESTEAWRTVLDDLARRGLRRHEFLIVDGAPGLDKAIAADRGGAPWPQREGNVLPTAKLTEGDVLRTAQMITAKGTLALPSRFHPRRSRRPIGGARPRPDGPRSRFRSGKSSSDWRICA